ncbi:MAG: peptidylprolyl isomerase [Oscillospiraceae bacterium]|nr:peptidylprolyl isomerase [Oscillospiraceae bacterium]
MKIFKKIAVVALSLSMITMMFSGCGKEDLLKEKADQTVAPMNFTAPEIGEKIAVIKVKDFGEIKIKFFPEYASKGVENFIGLAEMDYYDELIYHRVVQDFVIQGGDPRGDGAGGNSVWGQDFAVDAAPNLYHFSGAVAYAHAKGGGNGSQFYIVCTKEGETYANEGIPLTKEIIDQYKYTNEVKALYMEKGGLPFLDGGYTVFGQVFEGMDVVYAISEVKVDPQTSMPAKQVVIESVEIVEYQG